MRPRPLDVAAPYLPQIALAICVCVLSTVSMHADELDDLCGLYRRAPVENGWHVVTVSRKPGDKARLEWRNKADAAWVLTPDLKNHVLHTDKSNPYFDDPDHRDVGIVYRAGKPIGLRFGGETYTRDGAKVLQQVGYGLHGYVTVGVEAPPADYVYGYGFYSTAFRLLDKPIGDFQAGLAGTWILPNNDGFKRPLLPPDIQKNWREIDKKTDFGNFGNVFQTIEGSLGFWGSTQFHTVVPKYRMNGTADGYENEISSPSWRFGVTEPPKESALAIAQISNRLLVPPDGFTFDRKTERELMGIAWIALPLVPAHDANGVPTGDQAWTFFVNTASFSGPVAFWVPDAFSRLSQRYKVITGRGMDARPGSMGGVGMEIAGMAAFEARDRKGVLYRRIPRLNFPVNHRSQTVLTQDIAAYSKQALWNDIARFHQTNKLSSGELNAAGIHFCKLTLNKALFDQGPDNTPIEGTENFVEEKLFGALPSLAYGLSWKDPATAGKFPEYFKQAGDKMVAITADQVPLETHLVEQEFASPGAGGAYFTPEDPKSLWKSPGPKAGPFRVKLNDGSTLTYSWYRFADQPTIVAQKWPDEKRAQLQKLIERMHRHWPIDGKYLAPPSRGALARLEEGLVVTPPAGLEAGYVPIVTRQAPEGDKGEIPANKQKNPRRARN